MIYIAANIPDFDEADETTYETYFINFEQGYCSEEMANRFMNYGISYFPGMEAVDLCGYAIMIQLLDSNFMPLVDPTATYIEGNYSGRILEAGKPCPPYCSFQFM